jgi:rhodanese-related sulfurtransferase
VQILKQNGYENAYALIGGTAAWKNAGFPMEQSEQK